MISRLSIGLVLLLVLAGCSNRTVEFQMYDGPTEHSVEFRLDPFDPKEDPVLLFKHEDDWETHIYCDREVVQEEMEWYEFLTRCPHDKFSIVRVPPNE